MIVIASHPADDHAAGVLAALRHRRQPVRLVDTALFPTKTRIALHYGATEATGTLRSDDGTLELGDVGVVWWRRPQPFTLDPAIDPAAASFAYSECHEAMAGMWQTLDAAWVNPPAADEVANHKPYQLSIAHAVGLTVPTTLVTNDPAAARAIVDERGSEGATVYKTFLATPSHWRETRVLAPGESAQFDLLRLAPVIFQERVHANANLRVTIIGDRVFTTEIRPGAAAYQLDYRVDMAAATFEPSELPSDIEELLRRLIDRLGLVYGAIDLLRTDDNRYLFLEINPAGEWRFVEERTGQPMTEAMADLLCGLDNEECGT
jgi:hypothetical protein